MQYMIYIITAVYTILCAGTQQLVHKFTIYDILPYIMHTLHLYTVLTTIHHITLHYRWAMGDAEEVVLFIRECLNMDTVLKVSIYPTHTGLSVTRV